jgi:hypothetical protein
MAMGVPANSKRGVPFSMTPFPPGDPFLQFVAQGIHLFGETDRIVEERELHDQQGVEAADGDRVRLAGPEKPPQGLAAGVELHHGLPQGVRLDLPAGDLLHLVLEGPDFLEPELIIPFLLALRKLHHIQGHVFAQQLPGLLLAVAGGLPDHQVADLDVRTQPGQLETDRGLDQGAQVAREDLLGRRDGNFGSATQPNADAASRQDDLLRHIDTIGPENLAALGPMVHQLFHPQAVDLRDHEIEVSHAGRPVGLFQVEVPIDGGEDPQKGIMGLQVQAQFRPHRMVVGHVCLPLDPKMEKWLKGPPCSIR